jgi:hypothetical protein
VPPAPPSGRSSTPSTESRHVSARRDRRRVRRIPDTIARGNGRRQAIARLLRLAEERDSGQIVRVVRFLAATYDGVTFPLDPFELRAVDIAISDDMLCCLDALRWGCADLHTLVPDGDARMRAVIHRWGLRWPSDA